MERPVVTAHTFPEAPRRVYWELTRACDLACRHCRAAAQPGRAPEELDTEQGIRVLDELGAASPRPHIVFTGGDPLKRPDLLHLVSYATAIGLDVAVAPSATPALSKTLAGALHGAGVDAMSLSLDGPTPAAHDRIRGVFGCFGWTLAAAQHIVAAGIELQINTLVTDQTEEDLAETAKVVARLGAGRWSLFFVVPVGRARALPVPEAHSCERLLRWLARHDGSWPFSVSTTEAPHYRRVLLQTSRTQADADARRLPAARSFGIRDGNGIMFIAADGDVYPSGFLPLAAGNVADSSPLTIYREAPLFRSLRVPDRFHGRCGICPYRHICGGSRARAFAATGDVLGEDPLCAWDPAV